MNDAKVLGVIGLGSMGYGAAVSAMKRGVSTIGLDSSAAARERFAAAGGQLAVSLADLAARCDVVQVLVVNAMQTEAVLFGEQGLAATLRRGAVVIASATVDPTLPPQWEAKLAESGIHFIDGPVSGTSDSETRDSTSKIVALSNSRDPNSSPPSR